MTRRPLREPTLLRRAMDLGHRLQLRLGGLVKGPSAGMRTDAVVDGRPVLFIHNPRTAGRTVEAMLGVKRLSHRFPSEKLTEAQWLDAFVVSAVRHPLDRFWSHYKKVVTSGKPNRLVKLYGEGVYDLTPMEFFDLIGLHPHYGGPQTQWTDFPCVAKPRADLVLRFEEIGRWPEVLREAGVIEGDVEMKHFGSSARRGGRRKVKFSQAEVDAVRAAVEARYAGDYATFGYERRDGKV
jgi:hypothetical protein